MEQQHTIDIDETEHGQEEEEEIKQMEQQHNIDIDEREHRQEEEEEEEEGPCIFRVHEELRHVNEKAYTPVLVSIGPYHHGQPKLLPMERHKESYLRLLLQSNGQSEEHYLDWMTGLEERARKYYADPVDNLDSCTFRKMMLHDACFVIYFLRGILHLVQGPVVDDDPIFNVAWMNIRICCDLMLLENQLPFFVISEFYDMSYNVTQNANQKHPTSTLTKMAMNPIFKMLPGESGISRNDFENTGVSECKHFLDLVHNVCLPTELSNDRQNKNPRASLTMRCVIDTMRCVIDLKDAGVKFKANEEGYNGRSHSMFDIRFDDGHFKIPKFNVNNLTETFFRNIIAYEQHSSNEEPKYFTDYTALMYQLINSKEDVNQLRRHEVLTNWLGDDEEVVVLFNKLATGTISLPSFYYSKLCDKVNAHCTTWRNRILLHEDAVTLKRNYFKNIWVTVATISGAFLLFLTLIQTVIALITIITSSPFPH